LDRGVADKLARGLRRLEQAGDDADALGAALISLHGALEDHVRLTLAANPSLGAEQQAAVQDVRRTQWKELLDLMQLYLDVTPPQRASIARANTLRQQVAHGGRYGGSRQELTEYAALVKQLVGYVEPAAPASKGRAKGQRADDPFATVVLDEATVAPARRAAKQKVPQPKIATRRPAQPQTASPPATQRSIGWSGALAALLLLCAVACSALWAVLAAPNAPNGEAAAPAVTAVPTLVLPRGATVSGLGGVPLLVRVAPAITAEPLDVTLSEGQRVIVIGGPRRADGYTWWQIDSEGTQGWCAGAYLSIDP
jgi:hypothetical protein